MTSPTTECRQLSTKEESVTMTTGHKTEEATSYVVNVAKLTTTSDRIEKGMSSSTTTTTTTTTPFATSEMTGSDGTPDNNENKQSTETSDLTSNTNRKSLENVKQSTLYVKSGELLLACRLDPNGGGVGDSGAGRL